MIDASPHLKHFYLSSVHLVVPLSVSLEEGKNIKDEQSRKIS
jgi:hypothetical protein